MKILRRGKPRKTEKTYTVTCGCDTKFSFTYSEGKFHADSRDGDYLEVACPICHEVSRVDVTLGR